MALIKFVAEYTDGSYNFLVLETGADQHSYCSEQGCTRIPDCKVFDVEGDPMDYCKEHALALDNDMELRWRKTTGEKASHEIVIDWISRNPALFIEIV